VSEHDAGGRGAAAGLHAGGRRRGLVRTGRSPSVVDRTTGCLIGIVTLDDVLLSAGDTLEHVVRLLNAERHEHAGLAAVLRRRQTA